MIKVIVKQLIANQIISQEEEEIYEFGLESLILKFIHCISYLCIGIYLNQLPELIIIAFVLIPLRRSAGGYHARTRMGCYIFSCIYIFSTLLILQAIQSEFIWWMILVISDVIIILMSPADNENKKLDTNEIEYYSKKVRLILICVNMICVLLSVLHLSQIEVVIKSLACGVFAEAGLLLFHKVFDIYNRKCQHIT